MEERASSKLATAAAASLLAFCLIGAGWYGSRERVLQPFREIVGKFDATRTVGGVARGLEATLAQAYDDPARAITELDRYSWHVSTIPSPFVGVAPEPGDQLGAHINSQQFRHPVPLAIPKPPGVFRVFVTGGSTAYGSGAPSDETTITGFLQGIVDRELAPRTGRRIEIVNAANPAWVSTHERILIANRLSEFDPDLVVSLSGNNDAHFGFLGLHSLWFRTYTEHFQALLLSDLLDRVRGTPIPFGGTWTPAVDGPVPPHEVTRRLAKNLRLAATSLEETGAPYVYCLQPTLAVTRKQLSARERGHLELEQLGPGSADYFRACYQSYLERLPGLDFPGFHFVDASTALDDRRADEEIFLDSYHFGDRGNRILARRLFELLRPWLEPDPASPDPFQEQPHGRLAADM